MKWILFIFLSVLIVKIDQVMTWVDRLSEKLQKDSTSTSEVILTQERIPIAKDQALQDSPEQSFIEILNFFYQTPSEENLNFVLNYLKDHEDLLSKMTPELKGRFQNLESLVIQRNSFANLLLLELLKLGDKKSISFFKRIFSLNFEIDLDGFVPFYFEKGEDPYCLLAGYFPETLIIDERDQFLNTRAINLEDYQDKFKDHKEISGYVEKCLKVIETMRVRLKTAEPTSHN